MPTTTTYTTKRAFPYKGEQLIKGQRVEMHPREARYLIGTHLEVAANTTKPKVKSKKTEETTNG